MGSPLGLPAAAGGDGAFGDEEEEEPLWGSELPPPSHMSDLLAQLDR